MSRLSDRIRKADDLESELVPVPQWGEGVEILVRGMDGRQRAGFMKRLTDARESDDDNALPEVELDLIIACSYDPEDNTPVFTDEDVDWLFDKAGAVIAKLSRVAMRVSGLAPETEAEVGKGGSSTTTPSTSSSSSATS